MIKQIRTDRRMTGMFIDGPDFGRLASKRPGVGGPHRQL